MAPATRQPFNKYVFGLSPQAIGRVPDNISDLRKLLRQRAGLAPNHADGAGWCRGIEPRDGNRSRARFDADCHFRDESNADSGAHHLNKR